MSNWSHDGLLVFLTEDEGHSCIKFMRKHHGFHFGAGDCGRGLYSPTWDRCMGEWQDVRTKDGHKRMLLVTPSIICSYMQSLTPKTEERLPYNRLIARPWT